MLGTIATRLFIATSVSSDCTEDKWLHEAHCMLCSAQIKPWQTQQPANIKLK